MHTPLLARLLRQSPSPTGRSGRWSRTLALVGTLLALAGSAQAQLAGGTYTIGPSGTYPTFAAAFAVLNNPAGISGPVTFNVAGTTFTEANLVLNQVAGASTTNTITFQGVAGSTISAAAGTNANASTTTRDAIVVLNGADFVTFNGLTLVDNNATGNAQMEYGFLMVRPSNTNGCNNNTIQNCTITLQKVNTTGTNNAAIGIASLPFTTLTVGGTALSPTGATAAGQSSNNRFFGNTIRNVYTGIYLLGLLDATPFANYDQNNDVGGAAAGTGNTIQNFGGVASNTAIAYGVRAQYQNNFSARYNTVNNTASSGSNATAALYGVLYNTGSNATVNLSNNTVTLTQGASSTLSGVECAAGGSNAASTTTMSNNTVNLTTTVGATALSGQMTGVYNSGSTGTIAMSNNTIGLTANITGTVGYSGTNYGLYNTGASAGTTTINANTFSWVRTGVAFTGTATLATGSIYGIFNSGLATGGETFSNNIWGPASGTAVVANTATNYGLYNSTSTPNVTATGNFVRNLAKTNGSFYCFYNLGSPASGTHTVTNNTITNIDISNLGASGTGVSGTGTLYAIYMSTAAAQSQVFTSNTVSNATSGSGSIYGLYVGSGAATSQFNNNNLSGLNVISGSGIIYGFYIGSGADQIQNNNISSFNSDGTGTVYGMYVNGIGTTISGNTVDDVNGNAATGSVYGLYNYGAAAAVFNNTIRSVRGGASSTAAVYGLFSAATGDVYNNTFGVSVNAPSLPAVASLGSGTVYGIYVTGAGVTVRNHTLTNISSTNGTVYGIYTAGTSGVQSVFRNKIYGIGTTGSAAGSAVVGIGVAGSAYTANIYNNLVGNLTAPAAIGLNAVTGIGVVSTSSTATANISFNTVYLAGNSGGANFGSSGVYVASAVPTVNLVSNIFDNTMSANGTGVTVAYRRSAAPTAVNSPPLTNNNNLYFAATPSATNLIYAEGITSPYGNPKQTLAAFKAYIAASTTREQSSVTEDVAFVSTAGATAGFLHINTSNPTQIEGGGLAVTGITDDYDTNTRQSPPDIGADEGAFTPLDLIAPGIAYTPLGNTGSVGTRTLVVTITDATGVDVTTANQPRLYYRKGTTGAYSSVTGTRTGPNDNLTVTFTIPAIAGLTGGDVVNYYVAAQDISQDNAGGPNGSSNPTGSTSVNPPGATFTGTPNSYTILPSIGGNIYVGTTAGPYGTPAYATLTAAAAAYNGSGLSGAVTFFLVDNAYNSEAYPITFNPNGDASATVTTTIKPYTNVAPVFTGSDPTALLVLNGTRFFTLDGSNNGTTSRDWTLNNTNTTTTPAVVSLTSTTGGLAPANTTVKNLVLTGNTPATTRYGVLMTTAAPATAGASNVTISNNLITKVQAGITATGLSSAVRDQNTTVSNNQIGAAGAGNGFGGPTATMGISASNQTGLNISGNLIQNATTSLAATIGIDLSNADNATVRNNTVQNLTTSGGSGATNPLTGVRLGTGVTGAVVDANNISGLLTTNTAGYGGYGIYVNTGMANGNNRVSNNFISDVNGSNYNLNFTNSSSAGIYLNGTQSGITIAYNSVNMFGNTARATLVYTAAMTVELGSTGLTVVNNILANGMTGATAGSLPYSLFSNAPVTAYTVINANDYYSYGSQAPASGVQVRYGSTDYTTLATLRTASGGDLKSVSVDPEFASTTDLHTTKLALNAAGVPVAGIATDYDGDTRNATTPDIGADEFTPSPNDVAVVSIDSPAQPVAAGSRTVTVTIKNTGTANLTSATLSYTLNGSMTPVTQNFTFAAVTPGNTTQLSFPAVQNAAVVPGSNTITVTGSLPNNSADGNASNNTQTLTFNTALLGNYTINKANPTAGTNFNSFADATAALTSGGIAGNVIFTVQSGPSTSPYTEQVVVPAFIGGSATAGVTFNGNGQFLQFAGTSTNMYVLALSGTSYVTVNNLVISNTSTATSNVGGVGIVNSDNCTVSSCTVNIPLTVTSTPSGGINITGSLTSATTGTSGSNNTVSGNTITGSYYGLTAYGLSTGLGTNNQFLNNTVQESYAYHIYAYYQTDVRIVGNNVLRPTRTTGTTFYGIFVSTGASGALVERNRVHQAFTSIATATTGYGIYASSGTSATATTPNVFRNNLVYDLDGNSTVYGIYNLGSAYSKFYHNTVNIDDQTNTSTSVTYGFYNSSATGVDFRNNIVRITRSGTGNKFAAYYSSTPATADYNDLYGSGTNFFVGYSGGNRATLADLQAASGTDANSKSVAPGFVSPATGNLQPTATQLNNTAQPGLATDDFLGNPRSATPDIGSYEFAPVAKDLAPAELLNPADGQTCLGGLAPQVQIRNTGTTAITFTPAAPGTVTVTVAGPTPATRTVSITSGTLASGATQDVTLPALPANIAPGNYTLTVTATVSGDLNAGNNNLDPAPTLTVVAPVAGTLSPTSATTCFSQGQILTLAGAANGTIQFQSATSAGGPFTDIAGANSASYTTAPTTVTTYYRAQTVCGSNVVTSNVATIMIDNPQPVSVTTPVGSVCEGSTKTITVVKTAGQTSAKLFTAASGGTEIAPSNVSGNTYTFNTPPLTVGTNTFYAVAATGSTAAVGLPNNSATYGTFGNPGSAGYGIGFNVTIPTVIASVDVYPYTAGANTIVISTVPTGNPGAAGATVATYNVTFTAAQVTAAASGTAVTVPLGAALPVGSYKINNTVGNLGRMNPFSGSYSSPLFTSPTVSIVGSYTSVASSTYAGATTYYSFFNFVFSTECEGSRTAVPVIATPAPAFSITPSTTQLICEGDNVSVTGTSPVGTYDTFVYTANTSAAVAGISQASTSSATATLSPTATTTYTVTASNSATINTGGCQVVRMLTINVNPAPVVTLTAPTTVACVGVPVSLTASNDQDGDPGVFRITEITVNKVTGQTSPYPAYFPTGDFDYIEISNLSNTAVDAGGLTLQGYSTTTTATGLTSALAYSFTFPTGTIVPARGVMTVIHGGTSVPANLVFASTNVALPTNFQSGASSGFVLRSSSAIIDAVALGNSIFPASAGVTSSDFSFGTNLLLTSGQAGVTRTASTDTNTSADFTVTSTTATPVVPQTIGTFNTAANYVVLTGNTVNPNFSYSYSASPNTGTFANASAQSTIFTPISDGPYTITLTTRNRTTGCIKKNTATVNTIQRNFTGTQNLTGSYCDVTIVGGTTTMTGDVTISGTLRVMDGATLNTNCNFVLGSGNFVLQAGGTLAVCSANGIRATATDNTTAIRNTGTRNFSTDANYVYNGTGAQVTGDGLPATVRSLSVANAAGLTLSQALAVRQVVNLTGGNLTTGSANNLTLLSTPGFASGANVGQTALINNVGTNVVLGNNNVLQRAVDNVYTGDNIGYHHYSSPMVSTTLGDLSAGTAFNPTFNSPSGYNTLVSVRYATPFPTVFGYTETRVGRTDVAQDVTAFDQGYEAPEATTPWLPGKGYTALVPNAVTLDFVGQFNNAPAATAFAGLSGLTRGSNANAGIAAQQGWQLVGNPFPAPLDLATIGAGQRTNLDAAYYVFHATSRYGGYYATYQGNVNLGTQSVVPAGGAFFVRVSNPTAAAAPGELRLGNANRVTTFGNQPDFGRATATRPVLTLAAVAADGTRDAVTLYVDAQATAGVDPAYDAVKLANPNGLNLATAAGATQLAIDGRPAFAATTVVPLRLTVPAAGTYVLDVATLANFGATQVYLRDAATGTDRLLSAGAQVSVALAGPAAASARYALVFQPAGALVTRALLDAAMVNLYPNPAHNRFTVVIPAVQGVNKVQATLVNALGQVVLRRTLTLSPATGVSAEFDTANLAAGVYSLQVRANGLQTTKRVVLE